LGVNTLKLANKNDMGGFRLYSAYCEHLQVRDALGKKSKRLSITAYCDYWELNYEMTVAFLNANR
jgi:hypothetical protein